ncbi:flavodoxin family protein [Methanoregula sp.]|uniref:flavodoxin family protein n=1 Tax=Methanoregula sp. TaxID=2052170 RepID=UPI003567DC40
MKTRIVYFSQNGHTMKIAAVLAAHTNAEIFRIEPETEPGPGAVIEGIKAFFSQTSQIKFCPADCSEIDVLVIATPVWSGKVPPYVNTYLLSVYGCAGKPFHVATCMRNRGAEGAVAAVRACLEKKGMKYISSTAITERAIENIACSSVLEKFAAGIRGKA